jgi:phytanoyl-CoA hydroxylase
MSPKAHFDGHGFAALRGFVPPAQVRQILAETERYIREVALEVPRTDVMYEDLADPASLKQMTRMHRHDAWFAALLEHGRFADLAAGLLGTAAVPRNIQYFNKPRTVSLPTPPHQDGYYFMLEPNHALTMWLALDHVDESNGCVRYVAGSHLRGVRPHARTQVLGFSQSLTDYGEADQAAEACLAAEPGDLLVHHSLTIHRAEANRSERSRRALGLIYYSAEAREDADAHVRYQQQLKEQLEKAGRI